MNAHGSVNASQPQGASEAQLLVPLCSEFRPSFCEEEGWNVWRSCGCLLTPQEQQRPGPARPGPVPFRKFPSETLSIVSLLLFHPHSSVYMWDRSRGSQTRPGS